MTVNPRHTTQPAMAQAGEFMGCYDAFQRDFQPRLANSDQALNNELP